MPPERTRGISNEEFQHLQVHLINDYLNGYTEKLSAGGLGKIKMDKTMFDQVLREVHNGESNPYKEYPTMKSQLNAGVQETLAEKRIQKNLDIINPDDEHELENEVKLLTQQYDLKKNRKKLENYLKGHSINNFNKFNQVMSHYSHLHTGFHQ